MLSDAEFPFVVGLYFKEDTYPKEFLENASCTGTIIDKGWVLTAAHCIQELRPSGLIKKPDTILIGTGYLAKKRSTAKTLLRVKNIYTFSNQENYFLTMMWLYYNWLKSLILNPLLCQH